MSRRRGRRWSACRARSLPTRSEPCTWVPVRDLAGTSARDVVDAVREDGEDHSLDAELLVLSGPLEQLVQEHEQAMSATLGNASLASLLRPEAVAAASSTANAEAAAPPPESADDETLPEPAVRDGLGG